MAAMLARLALLPLLAAPAWADCPAVPDRNAALADLSAQARAAPNEMTGRDLSDRMWAIWAAAPDALAQEMLDRGMAARRAFDFLNALAAFDDLVAYCPDYAEGYNQRAFVRFLTEDYAAAIVDLNLALARQPRHAAALAGLALSHFGLGQEAAGQAALRRALEINPWLPERGLLRPAPGRDL